MRNPIRTSDGVVQWDCVWFGNYPQSDVSGSRKEPIKWRVLQVNGNDAFLLADQCLDARPFHYRRDEDVTWKTCFLRGWLNGEFLDKAFSAEEQNAIITTTVKTKFKYPSGLKTEICTTDRVFLLSIDDVINPAYGFSMNGIDDARKATHTAYAESTPDKTMEYSMDWWWLRTSALSRIEITASLVRDNGHVGMNMYSADAEGLKVRPALHLDLSSSVWSCAGVLNVKVNGDMNENKLSWVLRKDIAASYFKTEAVKKLNHQKILILIAKGDDSPDIRKIATRKLYDRETLIHIARHDINESVRKAALEKIDDQETLIYCALHDDSMTVKYDAVRRVTDPDTLIYIALNEYYWPIRQAAVERLDDQETLIRIASNDCDVRVRKTAKERLESIGS